MNEGRDLEGFRPFCLSPCSRGQLEDLLGESGYFLESTVGEECRREEREAGGDA